MVLEIYKSDGKIAQMLSFKEMRQIPMSVCKCGTLYSALPDTFFGGIDSLSICIDCRIELLKKLGLW